MFHQFYATTKDRKGHEHNYKLPAGEGVPSGHEIESLAVASRWKLAEVLDTETYELLKYAFNLKGRRATA